MWMTVAGLTLGAGLIVSGARAVVRRVARASAVGEDERSYEGPSAAALGAVWIVLGLSLVAFSLAPASAGGFLGLLRSLGRLFLES